MIHTLSSDKIKHNTVILSGFEFIEQRPLGFFEFDNPQEKDMIFIRKENIDAKGVLKLKEYGFEPKKNQGRYYSEEVCIVSRSKARRVLIFQDTEFCKQFHDNVFVIPIQSFKEPIKNDYSDENIYNEDLRYFQQVINRDEKVFNEYYFPLINENGDIKKHRKLILSDSRFIHNSMLFEVKEESCLTSQELKDIGNRLNKMLNIKENNTQCEDCEYIRMYDSVKKIISRLERLEKLQKNA